MSNADLAQSQNLTFLNRRERVGWPPAWDSSTGSKLWDYNLHYHDFLWVLPFEDALIAVRDWIDHYEIARERVGWDPYPISIRLQNWCMYFFGRHRSKAPEDSDAAVDLWQSIFDQATRLERRIEKHLLANHILENGAALSFAGATFDCQAGEQWLDKGIHILSSHLDEIVLSDGGHAERSPMYHARLCQMLENLVRTGNERIIEVVQAPLRRAWPVLARLSHPDGRIALLNDSAFGIYPGITELGMEAAEPGVFAFSDTGYYAGRTEDDHYLVCDAGPIGPDYQPGHGHGDTLAFELSVHGVRFFVDAGVFNYEKDRWRDYARSTRAHNTVELNRLDQCDFWGAFRVGRRAYPRKVNFVEDGMGFSLEAEHTGYDHLPGGPVHRRHFRWFEEGLLMVRDMVTGERPVWVRSQVHLHHEVGLEFLSDRCILLRRGNVTCTITFAEAGRLTVEPAWYFPEFGRRFRSRVLVTSMRASSATSAFCIAPGETPPTFDLENGARTGDAEYRW